MSIYRIERRSKIAGVQFDFVLKSHVLRIVRHWQARGRREYIVLSNPHSTLLCHRDPDMRRATAAAGLTLPDGVGVILGARLLGLGRRHRVTGTALMLELCDAARELDFRHYFYGGEPGVADRLAERLSQTYPGLKVAGAYCPPFRPLTPAEDADVVSRINAARPDIVWVGLGAPKQEKWMAQHRGRIAATAMVGVGAAFDFFSGNIARAPDWACRYGLEWAFRLCQNPQRMWRRNLDSPLFLLAVIDQAMREAGDRAAQKAWSALRAAARWITGAPAPQPAPRDPAMAIVGPETAAENQRPDLRVAA